MDEIIKSKKQKSTQHLPYEIIENILSRLPVKSLLRFKSVSKQWESTISDPKFAENHLQQSKNSSSCRNLLAWDARSLQEVHVVKVENNKFRLLSAIEYPRQEYLGRDILCYCDGLLLKYCNHVDKGYVLWNISSRTYKKFRCPYPIDDRRIKTLYGICYDPMMKHYKVVIANMKHYAVFYCRNNKWSEMREMKELSCGDHVNNSNGVSFDGSSYWSVTTKRVEEAFHRFEIVCFDAREERFKKLPMADCHGQADLFCFPSSGGHLCLFPRVVYASRNEMRIVKKVGEDDDDSWVEFKVQLPVSFSYAIPMCFMNEDEIILVVRDPENYQVYNLCKKTFAGIQKFWPRIFPRPVPYQENLFSL